MSGFLRAMQEEDLAAARKYLDRRGRPPQGLTWSDLAERLDVAIELRMAVDVAALSDAPEGDAEDGESVERIGVIKYDRIGIPVTLERVSHGGGKIWLFSSQTLQALPESHAPPASARPLVELLPDAWRARQFAGMWSWQWLGIAFALLVALPLGYAAGRLVCRAALKLAKTTSSAWDDAVVEQTQAAIRFLFAWIAFAVVVENLGLPPAFDPWVTVATRTPAIITVGWITRAAVRAVTSVYLHKTQDDEELNSRGLRTQISILRRLSTVAILIVTASVVLMQFELVRNVGLSLLASAGVAGVALGFAAKESLANVIAGLQLSISQTVRLGDVIVFEGQWGRVEEIALTYVRLRLLDDRHMIVPISNLLTNTVENWSTPEQGLIGIIEFAVDPSVPTDRLRHALEGFAREHDNHDGRELAVQVLELDERRAWVRARISSRDLSQLFQMRCDIRESVMAFLQKLEGGRYLARARYERVDVAPNAGP